MSLMARKTNCILFLTSNGISLGDKTVNFVKRPHMISVGVENVEGSLNESTVISKMCVPVGGKLVPTHLHATSNLKEKKTVEQEAFRERRHICDL